MSFRERHATWRPIIKIVLGLPASSEVDVECDFVGVPFPSHTTSAFGKEFVSISRFECFSHQRTANFRGPVHSDKRACNAFMAPLTFRQLVEVSIALSTLVPIAVADVQTASICHAKSELVTRSRVTSNEISAIPKRGFHHSLNRD